MNVAFLAHANANGFYRGIGPMSVLGQTGHTVQQLDPGDRRSRIRALAGVDALHIHRYCDAETLRLVREAKARGLAVIWDDDDDGGALPRSDPLYRKLGGANWERRLATMRRLFALADLVTAPSAVLAARLAADGAPRTRVVENYVADEFIAAAPRSHDGIVIGWVAGREHGVDADSLKLRSTLQRVLDERPDVRVEVVGVDLQLDAERYRHVKAVHISELPAYIAGWDIALAPLSDIPFNRSRSDIKLKEYAAVGVPWLASPIGPYAKHGEKQGGLLVGDDAWHVEIDRIVESGRLRRKLAKRAARWGSQQSLVANARHWEAVIDEALAFARTRPLTAA